MSSAEVPVARRARRASWRDPRIVGGVVIMAVCVLVGGWLFGSGEEGRTVLVASHDVVAGSRLGPDDVTARRARLAGDLADGYFASSSQLPADAHVAHGLDAGELVPRAALEHDRGAGRVEVPLAVAPEDLPGTVRPGSVVDVWVLPDDGQAAAGRSAARRVLSGVPVLKVAGSGTRLAPRETRQVIVTLPGGSAGSDHLAAALASIASGRVLVVRRG